MVMSRDTAVKGLRFLLAALAELRGKYDLSLVVVGRTMGDGLTENLMERLGITAQVTFRDRIDTDELVNLYRSATLVAVPSTYEGFGIPPLEAMACGCPVIASNASSVPEVCGDAAFYIDPYDIESIADGMYKVLTGEGLRRDLITKGFRRVKVFSWNESAKKVLNIINEATKMVNKK